MPMNSIGIRQSPRGKLRNVEQLRRAGSLGCQGVTKHRIAEGACRAYYLRSGRGQLAGAGVAHTLAGFFSQKHQPATARGSS
jgi:hypothetical protein